MRRRLWPAALLLGSAVALLARPGVGFYLPGVAPKDFVKGEAMDIKVNKLASTRNNLPYDYYSIPYCRPDVIRQKPENIGEILRGDRIKTSPYVAYAMEDHYCNVLCRIDSLSADQMQAFVEKIQDEYRAYMILDNLPLATVYEVQNADGSLSYQYTRGFPVGFASKDDQGKTRYYLNNHLRLTILMHPYTHANGDGLAETTYRVVGFEVVALSRKHSVDATSPISPSPLNPAGIDLKTCLMSRDTVSVFGMYSEQKQGLREGEEVIFTYDVQFRLSDKEWATRWEDFFNSDGTADIHWFSIINSLMIVLFLTGMVAIILLRTLRREISNYNEVSADEETTIEESGWKLIHGDVFRPPRNASSLAAYVGTGVQLLSATLITMLFAVMGFLSPANRGGLQTAMILLFVFMGLVGGYAAARVYRQMKGDEWRKMTLKMGATLPAAVFVPLFVVNLFVRAAGSSSAIPFGTLLTIAFLWVGVSLPLVFLGSYTGFKAAPYEDPVRTNKIPRQIPAQPWYLHAWSVMAVGGLLPFGAVFVELYFIMSSLWLQQFYYVFGFLALVIAILLVTVAEIAVVLTYFQLSAEDYRWWWRSLFVSGASAFYVFGYSVYYYTARLQIDRFVPSLVYFATMAAFSYCFFVLTGTVGFLTCYAFVRQVYAAVKID